MAEYITPDSIREIELGEHDSTTTPTKKVMLYGWDAVNLQKVRLKVDADGEIQADIIPATAIGDGTATVTTAGTEVQLSAQACKRVFIQAHESNTGTIVVGGSTVVATLVGRRGKVLYPTQGDWFYVNNLNLLYIDSTANGDKVNYYYEV